MKNLKVNTRIFLVALATLFSISVTTAAHATDAVKDFPVSVKYYHSGFSAPVFQLSFTNDKVAKFEIVIKDKYSTIFTETLLGKGLIRKFQFVNNELSGDLTEDETISVEIRNITENTVVAYTIHPNSRVEKEKELVAKL